MHDPIGPGPNEMDDARDDDDLIGSVARELRRPVAIGGADFTARLMAEVERTPVVRHAPRLTGVPEAPRPRTTSGVLGWIVRPRTVRVSPLVGLAAAAGIALVAVLAVPRGDVERAPDTASAALAPIAVEQAVASRQSPVADTIEFVLHHADARTVAVAGDFNDWNPTVTPLARRDGGLWVARVPLPAGRYEYTFVVDGTTWTPDPAAPPAPAGDFGATNSVLSVGGAR